jgi:hypothetical protein
MNSKELLKLLGERYPSPDQAFLPEFCARTGFSPSRADAIAMHLWPSMGLELIGFELKVSRADWLREMKQPDKADPVKQFCDRWYLVVPDLKIVKYYDELPIGWGLMHVENGALRTMFEAEKLSPKPIDRFFLAALMRRATKNLTN